MIASISATNYTDSNLSASTSYDYTVVASNGGGNSPATGAVTLTTSAEPPSFDLGSADEPSGYLVDDPGMRIFAAIRGTLLYVGTWTPSGGVNDHFILVTDSLEPSATETPPWDKAGASAVPSGKPYLGAESDSDYISWFNVGATSEATATQPAVVGWKGSST